MFDGAAAAGFNPTAVAGCLLWLRADRGVTLNVAEVSSWADQSGAGDATRDAVQATGALQPHFTASTAAYNGEPTVDFAGAELLRTGTWDVSPGVPEQPCTVIFAGHTTSQAHATYAFDNSVDPPQMACIDGASTVVSAYAGTSLQTAVTTFNVGSVACVSFNGASSTIRVSQLTANVTGAAGAGNAIGLTIGNANVGGTFSWEGPMAEICVHAGVLSAPNVALIMNYMGARYGVAIGA